MEQTVENTQPVGGLSAPAPISQPTEKMLPQSKVDEIVKTAKLDAAHKARQEAMEEYQRQQQSQQSNSSSVTDPDYFRKIAQEEAKNFLNNVVQQHQQQLYQQEGQRMAGEFESRIKAANEQYPDLWKKVESLGVANFAPVIAGALEHENTADIINDLLVENPLKLAGVLTLYEKNPALAKNQMQNLASSIKLNQAASNVQRPQEPLSQITTSNAGIPDDGKRTVEDYRRWLARKRR